MPDLYYKAVQNFWNEIGKIDQSIVVFATDSSGRLVAVVVKDGFREFEGVRKGEFRAGMAGEAQEDGKYLCNKGD